MQTLELIIVSAILAESVVNALKPLWDEQKRTVSYGALASLAIGLIIAFASQLDIAGMLGLNLSWPFLGYAFSGIIISRGANYVYDIINGLQAKNTDARPGP